MTALLLIALSACGTPAPKTETPAEPYNIDVLGTSVTVTPDSRLDKIIKSGKIMLATNPAYAPYEFILLEKLGQPDQYAGSDIELAKFIAESLGVELVIESMSYEGTLVSVTENKTDMGIAGIMPKPDRKTKMDFSEVYYGSEEGSHGFLVSVSKADGFKTLEDLNKPGIKIAAQNGSVQHSAVAEQLPQAELVTIGDLGEGILEILSGKIDGLAISSNAAEGFEKTYAGKIVYCEAHLDVELTGIAIGIPKNNEDLVAAIDAVVEHVKKEGLYVKWLAEAKEISETQMILEQE